MGRPPAGPGRAPVSGLRRAAARLLAIGLAVLLGAGAASAEVLVSNIGQAGTATSTLAQFDQAQGFTTGSQTGGYALSGIEVRFTAAPASVSVKLMTGVSTTSAGTAVATLANPSTLAAGNLTFTAPADTTLTAETEYFVVIEGSAGFILLADSGGEDAGGAAGWSVADNGFFRAASSTGAWTRSGSIRKIRVIGPAAPAAPDAPTVSKTDGTSLTVSWTAPAGTSPAITDYDVQYRRVNASAAGANTDWTDHAHDGAALTATITGLVQGASYEARVRATNSLGTGGWSAAGAGHTGPARFVSAFVHTSGNSVVIAFTKNLLRPGDSLRYRVRVNGTTRPTPAFNTVSLIDGIAVVRVPGAVIQFGQTVQVLYTKPSSGNDAQFLTDIDGERMSSFGFETATNNVPPPEPIVSKATLQGTTLEITFNKALDTTKTPAKSAFTVKLGTATQTLATSNAVAVSGSVVTLTLASAPGAGSVTVDYAKPTGASATKLTGSNMLEVNSFTGQAVIRPATVASATTNDTGTEVRITFTKNVSEGASASLYTVTVGGTNRTPSSASASGKVLTLTLSAAHAATAAQTVTVGYAKPASGELLDADGLDIESFTGQSVTNAVTAQFQSATTDLIVQNRATVVAITFTANLMGPEPAANTFTITAGGDDITPTSAVRAVNLLNLHLPASGRQIQAGETVTVSYAKPSTGNKLKDANGRELESFTGEAVTNTVPLVVTGVAITSDPGPDKTYQRDDVIRVTVTFSAPATVDETGGTPALTMHFRGGGHPTQRDKQAPYASGSGTNMLVFAYTVLQADDSDTEGIGLPASRIALGGGTIKAGATDATLTYSAVGHDTNHKVDGPTAQDTTGPAVSTVSVSGATLTITFDEALDAAATAPAAGAFTVKVNGAAADLAGTNPVALSGSAVVTLTLAEAVIDADAVTVAYAKPDANPIRDFRAGNEAPSFADTDATNNTPGVAPTVEGMPVVGGTRLIITFDERLDENSTPAPGAFAVTVNGNSRGVTNVQVMGAQAILTLASAAAFMEAVTVQYTKPGTNPLQDRATPRNPVANFGPLPVTNNDNTPPAFVSASVEDAALTITFDETLDGTSKPAAGAFRVTVAGGRRSVTEVAVFGAEVTLTLAPAVRAGQAVMVRYVRPTTGTNNRLRDGAQNEVATFGDQDVTNATPAAVSGTPRVSGTRLVITFDAALDETSVPPASAFTVMVDGSPANLAGTNPVAISDRQVTLTLESAVSPGQQAVTVSYSGSALRDAAGNDIANFGSQQPLAVTNPRPRPPRLSGGGGGGSPPPPTGSPVADAGADLTVDPGSSVTLDGSASADPEGQTLTWAWTQSAGETVALAGADTAAPSFTAPSAPGALVFGLTVRDPGGLSGSDEVSVTVRDLAPGFGGALVASLTLVRGEAMEAVALPGASGGNGALSYALTSEPAGLAGLDFDPAARTLSGTPDAAGRYVFRWRADDADDNRSEADAAVLVFHVSVEMDARTAQVKRSVRRALAAVGRRALTSALENIGARFADAAAGTTGVTLAGHSLALGTLAAVPAGLERTCLAAAFEGGGDGRSAGCLTAQEITAEDLMRASAFAWTPAAGGGGEAPGGPLWAVWGRGDFGAFEGRPEPGVHYEGELRTGWLGFDARSGPWVAGLALSHASGEADYGFSAEGESGRGRLETALTALYPYGRWTFANGLELRGVVGAGRGEARHRLEGEARETSDLTMWMASVGLRHALPPLAGVDLAARADASLSRMETERGPDYVDGLSADGWRARVGLEASRRIALAGESALTPFVEAAARRDGGDGLTGAGVEIAGGVRYDAPRLRVELRGRWLAVHSEEGARERGVSLTVRMGPGARGRGFSLALSPRWGAPAGGAEALWGEEMPGAAAAAGEGAVDARVGYGFAWDSRGLLTPFAETSAGGESRLLRLGTRFDAARADLGVELAGERAESGAKEAVHGLRLDVSYRF